MSKQTKTHFYYQNRQTVPEKHRWNLQKMYPTLSAWEQDLKKVERQLVPLADFRGKLKTQPVILEYLKKSSGVLRQIEKIYVYASHLSSVDLADEKAQIAAQKAQNLFVKFSQIVSFQGPELAKLSEPVLKRLIAEQKFYPFHRELRLVLEQKKHILSDVEEALLSAYGKVTSGPEDIFSSLNDVDLTFNDVIDKKGKKHQLTAGNYQGFLENNDRDLRQRAFENVYTSYRNHIHTYAQTLNLMVKQHHFLSGARKYDSSLESALSSNLIDPKVYQTLIKQTNASLPELHRYFAFRAKKLGLKKLSMWDMRVNLLKAKPLQFTYEEAVQICLEAVKPLGADYVTQMAEGLRGGWVDIYENKGKRGGAFSGGCYDSNPYILMNFTGTLNDVYTLIHEAGHSMHSWLARHHQPYSLADYSLFIAEIASTVNERLLTAHLLNKFKGHQREIVLAYEIDAIRSTYFRQTMFAEFELKIHQQLEEGNPLTAEGFNKIYQDLNTRYHGPHVGKDEFIQYEWARIPHFYYNFYVYVYATGIAAAYYFSDLILDPKKGAVHTEDYLNLLRSGGNDFPLKQLHKAGLDFTKPYLYQAVAKNLRKCLNLL